MMQTSPSTSSADLFDLEDREEMRFLRAVKGVLRRDAAEIQERENLSQEQLAERMGFDPAQLSRILSSDRHNSTVSLFRAMYRLGRRWTFGSAPLPEGAQNRPTQNVIARSVHSTSTQAAISLSSGTGPAQSEVSTFPADELLKVNQLMRAITNHEYA